MDDSTIRLRVVDDSAEVSPEVRELMKRMAAKANQLQEQLQTLSKTEQQGPNMSFEQAVHDIRKNNFGIGRTAALERARIENPIAFEAYQKAEPAAPQPIAKAAKSKHEQDFDTAVHGIKECDGCGHVAAITRARKENPDLFLRTFK
jgi:hypothetical protein